MGKLFLFVIGVTVFAAAILFGVFCYVGSRMADVQREVNDDRF